MEKRRLIKIARAILAQILVIALIFSAVSPFIAEAMDISVANASQQQKWHDILDANLTNDKKNTLPVDTSVLQPAQDTAATDTTSVTPSESQVTTATIPPYMTDRFIVKYKSDTSKTSGDTKLSKKYKVDNIEVADNSTKSKDKANNGSGKNKDKIKLPKTSKVKADKFMTADEFKKDIAASGVSDSDIEYIQPDYEMTASAVELTDTTAFGTDENGNIAMVQVPSDTWAQEKIGVDASHKSSTGADIIVALLDTGIDTSHPDLAGHIYINPNETANGADNDGNGYIGDISGWDFVNNDSSVNDSDWYYDQWHSTHIAGIIANSAPDAKILLLKIFQGGTAYTSDIVAAIAYAEMMGATVANCSWGSMYDNPALREAIQNSSMLFVCASGNGLYNIDKYPVYPAALSKDFYNVISVASTNYNDIFSRQSNYGVNTVDVAAPGENIYSTSLNNSHVQMNGTSMSAGFVSGLAALIESNNAVNATDTKTRIIESSDTVTGLQDKIKGGKRINFAYAVSDNTAPNTAVIDVPDEEVLTEIVPYWDAQEDDYQEFGAEKFSDVRADMPNGGRHGLQVVTLNNKIYAIGGQTTATGGYTNIVQVYDPTTNTWDTTSCKPMNAARSYFGAFVYNGLIYVMGGYNGASYLNSIEVYNPSTNLWTTQTVVMPNPNGMKSFSATLVGSQVYIIGGYNTTGSLNSVYLYNITSNSWSACNSLSYTLSNHTAYYDSVINNIIINEGTTGAESSGYQNYINMVEAYSPSTQAVTNFNNSQTSNQNSALLNMSGNITLKIGGAYRYPNSSIGLPTIYTNRIWVTYSGLLPQYSVHMLVGRSGHGAALLNGKIYVIGGQNSSGIVNTVEEFNLGYETKPSLPITISDSMMTSCNDRIYSIGGTLVSNSTVSNSVYEYNPLANAWTKKANTPVSATARLGTTISLNGKIYLIGGLTSASTSANVYVTNVWEYNLLADTWTQKAALPEAITRASTAVYDNKIYIAGGYKSDGTVSSILRIYDPSSDTWSAKNTVTGSGYNKLFTLDDGLYTINGAGIYKYNYNPSTQTISWDLKNSSTPITSNSADVNKYCAIGNTLYCFTNPALTVKYLSSDNVWETSQRIIPAVGLLYGPIGNTNLK